MKTFRYTIKGTCPADTFQTEGNVKAEGMLGAIDEVFRDSFHKLTHGQATFGRPGEAGCSGPYQIKSLNIEEQS